MNSTESVIKWKILEHIFLSFYTHAEIFVYTTLTVNIYSSNTQAMQYSGDSNLMLFTVLILFGYSSAHSNLLYITIIMRTKKKEYFLIGFTWFLILKRKWWGCEAALRVDESRSYTCDFGTKEYWIIECNSLIFKLGSHASTEILLAIKYSSYLLYRLFLTNLGSSPTSVLFMPILLFGWSLLSLNWMLDFPPSFAHQMSLPVHQIQFLVLYSWSTLITWKYYSKNTHTHTHTHTHTQC